MLVLGGGAVDGVPTQGTDCTVGFVPGVGVFVGADPQVQPPMQLF